MNINVIIKFNYFKTRKEKLKNYEPSTSPENIFSIQMTITWCVGGRHYSNTNILVEYENVNTKTKKLVKVITGNCSIRGCSKSQVFTK